MLTVPIEAGPYTGMLAGNEPLPPETLSQLAEIKAWPGTGFASTGSDPVMRHTLMLDGKPRHLAVKSFAPAGWLRDAHFKQAGSRARRSFLAAVRLHEAGVGTPRPFVFLERWEGSRLHESYFLCDYAGEATSFRDELNRLYLEDPLCRRIMRLMETVALAIADMHDAGVCHRDLGNQNILLRRIDDDTWGEVQFIDLNRAHLANALTLKERARDISRIDLPSDFLRVFKCMYFRHQHPPAEFHRWEQHFRDRFARHTATRKYRHPIRQARQRKKDAALPFVPRGRELWVWDDRSMQAVSTLLSKDRKKLHTAAHHINTVRALVPALAPVWSLYKDKLASAFTQAVDLKGRIGVALVHSDESEQRYLHELAPAAGLVRLYAHEHEKVNERSLVAARQMKASGRKVFVALVQDRASVRDPARWRAFVDRWVPQLRGVADHLEIGHAVNRVKWGIWEAQEYRALVEPVVSAARGQIPLCGPGVIDFEYHYLPAFLREVSAGAFAALSHHLYVDRRGAPENRQGRFAALEKFALAKAIAGWSDAVAGDRLIVSEVNWPVLGTGEFSPVNSPYIIPGSHSNDPSVDEETYADYMIRYYALALCSGLVDDVYWWGLAARGFGLVDDTDPEAWRPRPAYRALQVFIRELGEARFVERMPAPAGTWALRFERAGKPPVILAWAHPEAADFQAPFALAGVLDRDGAEQATDPRRAIHLSGRPCYLIGN